jgi:transposase-like protein
MKMEFVAHRHLDAVLKMRANGMTLAAIARHYGVTKAAVYFWINPERRSVRTIKSKIWRVADPIGFDPAGVLEWRELKPMPAGLYFEDEAASLVQEARFKGEAPPAASVTSSALAWV